MRGRILQYNGNDGTGIVVADNQQHKFTLSAWKGDTAPAVGKTVEVVMNGSGIQSLTLVGDDVLLREKTAELTGKLGTLVGGVSSGLARAGASGAGGSVIARYGQPMLAAYVVFLLATLIFHFGTIQLFGQKLSWTLFGTAGALGQLNGGGGGGLKALLILSYAGIAVPLLWADKRGWLALLLPLVSVIWGWWSVHHALSGAGPTSDLFSYGFGFYLSCLAAIVLAGGGAKRFLGAGET
jgi:hypothetical protein